MTQLERLVVHFRTALPGRAIEHTFSSARATLPRLKLLSFRGSSAYLEGMLARLSAPALQTLFVDLFAQLTFDIPYLVRFVRAASAAEGGFRFYAAELHFDAETACVLLDPRVRRNMTARTNPVQLRVSCRALDWQLAALAQICECARAAVRACRGPHARPAYQPWLGCRVELGVEPRSVACAPPSVRRHKDIAARRPPRGAPPARAATVPRGIAAGAARAPSRRRRGT
jgi:hypothetical protein